MEPSMDSREDAEQPRHSIGSQDGCRTFELRHFSEYVVEFHAVQYP
jgi:hypothetical protein